MFHGFLGVVGCECELSKAFIQSLAAENLQCQGDDPALLNKSGREVSELT